MRLINIDFVVPTLNANPESLAICQNSILSQSGLFNKKIFVEKGYGFAAGVNQAIKRGKSSYLAIINDDIKLDKNWLSEAYNVLTAYTSYAAVATRVLTYDGKSTDSCGMEICVSGKARKRKYGKNKEEVFGAPCSAALFKREAIEGVGLFDEDFISYEEDIDLSFRLRLTGYKIYYAPYAIAYHKMHATSSKMGNLKARMDAKNWIYIIIKNYPRELLVKFFVPIIIERLRNLSGLTRQTFHIYKWKSLWMIPWSIFVTYLEVVIKIPLMLDKRFKLQKNKNYNIQNLDKWLKL